MIDALLAVFSAMLIVGCVGLLRFSERKNIVYARLHLAGVVDTACIALMIILGYPFIALIYLVLTPLSAHAVANAHYKMARGERR